MRPPRAAPPEGGETGPAGRSATRKRGSRSSGEGGAPFSPQERGRPATSAPRIPAHPRSRIRRGRRLVFDEDDLHAPVPLLPLRRRVLRDRPPLAEPGHRDLVGGRRPPLREGVGDAEGPRRGELEVPEGILRLRLDDRVVVRVPLDADPLRGLRPDLLGDAGEDRRGPRLHLLAPRVEEDRVLDPEHGALGARQVLDVPALDPRQPGETRLELLQPLLVLLAEGGGLPEAGPAGGGDLELRDPVAQRAVLALELVLVRLHVPGDLLPVPGRVALLLVLGARRAPGGEDEDEGERDRKSVV